MSTVSTSSQQAVILCCRLAGSLSGPSADSLSAGWGVLSSESQVLGVPFKVSLPQPILCSPESHDQPLLCSVLSEVLVGPDWDSHTEKPGDSSHRGSTEQGSQQLL